MAATAGIKNVGIEGLTFIDYDHDGDLDLYVASEMMMVAGISKSGTSAMWRNNGDGTFTNVDIGLSIFTAAANAIGTDYNNDRAVDLVVADWTGGTVFQNPREGTFLVFIPFHPQGAKMFLTPILRTFRPWALPRSILITTGGRILC